MEMEDFLSPVALTIGIIFYAVGMFFIWKYPMQTFPIIKDRIVVSIVALPICVGIAAMKVNQQ